MIKTFKDLKDRKWEGDGIPKWIFKTGPSKLEDLSELYKHIFLDILEKNPGYELFYFSDEDCMMSIHHHYGEEYLRLHQKLIPTAYQADLWRYLILKQYGGCYGDFSQISLVPYDEITEGVDRVFARDDPSPRNFLYNAVMCVKPNDEVVNRTIEISVENIRNSNYDNHPLGIVGPKILGQAFIDTGYNKTSNESQIYLGKYKGSNILRHLPGGRFIQDYLEKNVFVTKISNHYNVVYNNRKHYGELWYSRNVFRDKYMSEIKKYKDLKGRRWTDYGIPKWIFRTGGLEYEDLPKEIKTIYTHILDNNPGYELFYFSDADCVEFILEEYGKAYLDYYNTLIPTAYKADFFRYCLLNKYGGCYGDFTLLPLISYDEMTRGVDRVLVRDDGSGSKGSLWNASMCTKAEDPILYSCIAICIDHIITGYLGNNPLDITGPTVLGEAFRQVGYNTPNEFDIPLGDNRGSRIYMHDVNPHVKDVHGRAVIIKKMTDVHNTILYSETNVHYNEAWNHAKVYTHGRVCQKSISYAITGWNEHREMDRLLHQLKSVLKPNDEIVVQVDTTVTNELKDVIESHGLTAHIFALNNNFISFKNNLNKLCTKDYIFQIDGDEFLSDKLLRDIDVLIRIHNNIDVLKIPRINTLVDESIIEDYKNNSEWENDESSWINYPDAQTRLFKNKSDIMWGGDIIHTHLINFGTVKQLNKGYDLIHVKSYERQHWQDNFYKTF